MQYQLVRTLVVELVAIDIRDMRVHISSDAFEMGQVTAGSTLLVVE